MARQIKSKKRVRDFGEVFTPDFIVNKINDLCEPEISDITKRVLEPACGEGVFLCDILSRRLKKCKTPFECLVAVSGLYGIDIQDDNVFICRLNMYRETLTKCKDLLKDERNLAAFCDALTTILATTVLQGDTINKPEEIEFTFYEPIWEKESFGVITVALDKMIDKNNIV